MQGRPLRKLCLLGDYRVGKTRLACRLTGCEVTPPAFGVHLHYWHPTIAPGIEFALFDAAGRSALDSLGQSFLSGADGFALVADLSVPHSIQTAVLLHHRATELVGERPAVLLLNKRDRVADIPQPLPQGLPTFTVSAVSGEGVDTAFTALATMVLSHAEGTPRGPVTATPVTLS